MHYVMAKGILSAGGNINLYRGCTHGCIYCDSRSRCYHIDHAFEDVEVKQNAVELLEDALRRRRAPCMVGTGSMTDPYLPLEAELRLTRRAMEVVERYGCGFTVITKSDLILRDLDLLSRIQQNAKCVVQMTLTTADETLCSKLEPNVCTTAVRYCGSCRRPVFPRWCGFPPFYLLSTIPRRTSLPCWTAARKPVYGESSALAWG